MTGTTVAILGGTGPQGRGIALRLARAGTAVIIGSRDGDRAAATAGELAASGLPVTGTDNERAAAGAAIVVVAVPWDAHEPTLRALRDALAAKVVLDVVNPLRFDGNGPVGIVVPEGGAAQQAAALLPDSTVVSGFHHVSAKLLLDEDHALDEDVMFCGDDAEAKRAVMELAGTIPGLRPIDAGPLRLSGLVEGMTAVLLSINRRYRTTAGIRLTAVEPSRIRPD